MLFFSMNLKSDRLKKFLAVAALILLTLVVVLISPKIGNQKKQMYNADYSQKAARIFYLNRYKWDVEEIASQEITIPENFSKTYEEYNLLQQSQGFDLLNFRGKEAILYTYKVKNYAENEDNVRASLVVCENQIIAADLYSYEQNGFVRTLSSNG